MLKILQINTSEIKETLLLKIIYYISLKFVKTDYKVKQLIRITDNYYLKSKMLFLKILIVYTVHIETFFLV